MSEREQSMQYVYRLEIGKSVPVLPLNPGFVLFSSPWQLMAYGGALVRALGLKGVLKTAAKLLTATRLFFVVRQDNGVAHYGWVTLGRCRYYSVEHEAAVIGPVETEPEFRGRGLATAGLSSVIVTMAARGVRIFYIDTGDNNIPMQKVIAKCGFGGPISTYLRPEHGL